MTQQEENALNLLKSIEALTQPVNLVGKVKATLLLLSIYSSFMCDDNFDYKTKQHIKRAIERAYENLENCGFSRKESTEAVLELTNNLLRGL